MHWGIYLDKFHSDQYPEEVFVITSRKTVGFYHEGAFGNKTKQIEIKDICCVNMQTGVKLRRRMLGLRDVSVCKRAQCTSLVSWDWIPRIHLKIWVCSFPTNSTSTVEGRVRRITEACWCPPSQAQCKTVSKY